MDKTVKIFHRIFKKYLPKKTHSPNWWPSSSKKVTFSPYPISLKHATFLII